MNVLYRPIPGFPNYYAGIDGTIFSGISGKVLKPSDCNKGGYHFVGPMRDGKNCRRSVHSLVMLAFAGERPPGLVVLHADGDPANNALINLSYGTHKQNTADMIAHGRHRNARKTHCHQGHEFTPENTRMENGTRRCRECHKLTEQNRRHRLRGISTSSVPSA